MSRENPSFGQFVTSKLVCLGLVVLAAPAGADGAAAGETGGIYLVKDIRSGPAGSDPSDFVVSGRELFFSADDGLSGQELWASDGTAAGTRLVLDVEPGSGDSSLFPQVDVSGTVFLYRFGWAELWKSDGTASGTQLIEALSPIIPTEFTAAGGLLFFRHNDPQYGSEPWRSDGTPAGTFVLDLVPGPQDSRPGTFVEFLGDVFFEAEDINLDSEVLRSDGTLAGTSLLFEGQMSAPRVVGDKLYLRGSSPEVSGGAEPWMSDGTPEGTGMIKDIRDPGSSNPRDFFGANGWVLFWANDAVHSWEPWRTDGTEAGTTLVKDIYPGSFPSTPTFYDPNILELNGKAIFGADDGTHGGELWITDGSPEGTDMLVDIFPGTSINSSYPVHFTRFEGYIYFSAYTEAEGRELWRTDGTPGGTVMIDLRPGPESFNPDLYATANHLFIVGDNGVVGEEIWALAALFADGFESGDTSAWTTTVP